MLDLLGGRNEPDDEEAQEVSERSNEDEVFVMLHVLRCNLEKVLVYKVTNLACDNNIAQVADPCNKSKHRSLYLRWNYLCKQSQYWQKANSVAYNPKRKNAAINVKPIGHTHQ